MKKHNCTIRQIGKSICGGFMGAAMLFSGTLMPYQGIIPAQPFIGSAAEQPVPAAANQPYAAEAVFAAVTTTEKPAATTVKPTATTAKPAVTTAKSATSTASPVTATAAAQTTAVSGTDAKAFEFSVKDGAAVLERWSGDASEVTVPASYQGVPVTAIGAGAFKGNRNIESVVIPSGIQQIGDYAFAECKVLKKAVLPENLETLGYAAFDNTALTEIHIPASLKSAKQPFYACSALNKVTFGTGTTVIPDTLFRSCSGLTEITIPDTVTEIGSSAFAECKSLKMAVLPENLETLGYEAFDNTALTEIHIPASLKSAKQPFYACSALNKVTFGTGTTVIPDTLFRSCTGLTEITFPDTVTEIGSSAFAECRALKKTVLPENLETLGYETFENTALTEIHIPASLKSAKQPFYACKSLNKVTFGTGMTVIPGTLFRSCYGLTEITLPDTVTEIGSSAFAECRALKKAVLPDNLEKLGYAVFDNTALTGIHIPASLKSANQPFYACRSLNKVTFGSGMTVIPDSLFRSCYGLTEITLPDTVTKIGNYAFAGCKTLKKVILPENLETLGYAAFDKTALTGIRIPASLKSANQPFYACKSLEYAEFAEGTVMVPDSLFENAGGLKTVRLADTTQEIGKRAFASCGQLSRIEPQDLEPTFVSSSFSGCTQLYDQRFSLLDRTACSITVNSSLGSVSGLMHFTVKYKLNPKASNLKLELVLPGSLLLVPESVAGSDAKMTIERESKLISLTDHEGTLHFSARVQETGSAEVSANMKFTYNSSTWSQLIGTVAVTAPDLTVSAPDTVNDLSALVYGIAGKNQRVAVCVNGTQAGTATANACTGKYRVTVPLPQGEDGTVYQISAKTENAETEAISVTYRRNAPTVQAVTLFYNANTDEGKDITDVFLEGKSPVISYNPARPLQFSVKTANTEQIDRLFVTSTRGQEVRYMEAFYDAEKDVWLTEKGYFDPANHGYVPGTLNISIIEKQPELTVDSKDSDKYDAAIHLPDSTPQAYRDNSTVTVISRSDSAFAAEVNFTDGTEDHQFLYCSERSDTVTVNGQTVTAEEIAKDPEKYGYYRVPASAVNGDDRYTYYQRWDTDGDLLVGVMLDGVTQAADQCVGAYTGYSVLEILEGEHSDGAAACFINNFLVAKSQGSFDAITGNLYGEYAAYLRLADDSLHLVSRIYEARDNELQQCAAVMLFAAQVIVDSGGLELMLLTCGFTAPVAFLVTVGACVLLTYAGDWLDAWIADGEIFSSGGQMRFIIDPSGTVYEAVKSNPVPGAEVRIYFRDPETGEQTEWNASDYEQENPLMTGADGTYAWDVPEGEWKVVCTAQGYDKAESDWMTVPPVRTEIGLSLISHSAPAIVKTEEQQNGLLVQFSKFIDISTATEKSIALNNTAGYTVKPVLYADGDAFTDRFLLEGEFAAGIYTLSVTEALLSYAGTPADASEIKFTLKQGALQKGDINGDNGIDITDAQLTLTEYVNVMSGKQASFDAKQQKAGDIDGNGAVSLEDAQFILMYYVQNFVAGNHMTWDELMHPSAA